MPTILLDRGSTTEPVGIDRKVAEVPQERDGTTGERVRAEFKKLWNIYTGRRAGLSLTVGDKLYEDNVFATRDYHEQVIEEVYWQTRIWDTPENNLDETRCAETIFIRVSTESGEQEVRVDALGAVQVRAYDQETGAWVPMVDEEVCVTIEEFFDRAERAALIHLERSLDDRATADNKAIGLLYNRYPILALHQASDD